MGYEVVSLFWISLQSGILRLRLCCWCSTIPESGSLAYPRSRHGADSSMMQIEAGKTSMKSIIFANYHSKAGRTYSSVHEVHRLA